VSIFPPPFFRRIISRWLFNARGVYRGETSVGWVRVGRRTTEKGGGWGVGLIDNLVDRVAFVLNFALEEAR
jgi:hypothetical protein